MSVFNSVNKLLRLHINQNRTFGLTGLRPTNMTLGVISELADKVTKRRIPFLAMGNASVLTEYFKFCIFAASTNEETTSDTWADLETK